ncbi:putative RNA-binding Zn ribbon-like protein [Murinocardiopsis flavida]|uniref:Putative RNA-binding Zn ribbon-like protein n=2 Tax=Murinocardiopsis flavida TaxID=645275 RepID=A0A2P8D3H3_9ACTN|nr:putative RNA-binding Zn ribbon-like protein [Murinocardiopsis flavida]
MTLQSLEGTRFSFDPGALCLQFLTTGGPSPAGRRYEILYEPDDLARWLPQSRLGLDAADVRITTGELAAGRRMRDALWRVASAAANGEPHPGGDLAEINSTAAHPPLVPRITADSAHAWALPASGGQVLSTIARDAIDLLTGHFADRIRECGGHNCALIFVDTSRPGRRRWCSMERCGNRHKVQALRARRDLAERNGG